MKQPSAKCVFNLIIISSIELSSFLQFYIDDQPRLSTLWETEILQTPQQEKRLFLFQVSSAVIFESYQNSITVYQQSFAQFYRDHLKDVLSVITDRSILDKMERIISFWHLSNIYEDDFYFRLWSIISHRIYALKPENKYLLEENAKEAVGVIERSDLAKKLIELDAEEANIWNRKYELNFKKLVCTIEEYGKNLKAKRTTQLGVMEEKLKLFKEMVMIDLGKRENAIMNVANYMEKEKMRYALDEL